MSGIQDMNNRIKQNRNLRPSKRSKFKENNRDTIYDNSKKNDGIEFKEHSEFQIKKTISLIRKEAKSKKRKQLILLIISFGVIGVFFGYTIFTKEDIIRTNGDNIPSVNYELPPSLTWSGKLSEPLRISNSDYFYIPMIGNLDYFDLEKTYKISPYNMVVDYTSNILFIDKNCKILGKLLPENGSIKAMTVFPSNKEVNQKIIYRLTQEEKDTYGKLYNIKKHYIYISNLDGKNLTQITDRDVRSFQWDNKSKEILLYFFYNKKMNDSIHGIFNIETNKFRLSQLD